MPLEPNPRSASDALSRGFLLCTTRKPWHRHPMGDGHDWLPKSLGPVLRPLLPLRQIHLLRRQKRPGGSVSKFGPDSTIPGWNQNCMSLLHV